MCSYKKLLSYVPELRHYVVISVLLSCLSSVLSILPYWYLWKLLHDLFTDNNFVNIEFYATTIVVLMIAYGITYIGSVWMSHLVGFRLETNLRKIGIDHLMRASSSFFDTNSSGKIRKVIDDNASETHMIIAHLIPDNVAAFITPIGITALTFYIDWRLGIYIIFIILIAAFTIKKMTGDTKFLTLYTQTMDNMNSEAVEYVRGMQVVKIFGATIYSFKKFYQAILDYSEFCVKHSSTSRLPYVCFQIVLNIAPALLLPLIAMILNGGGNTQLILAKLVYFSVISGLFMLTFNKIMYVGQNSFKGVQAVEKLESLFEDMNKKRMNFGDLTEMSNFDIFFDNITFSYNDRTIFENFSLQLNQGKTYAIVGSSGGGKSTLVKLLAGFYPIQSGNIEIGNNNLSMYTEDTLNQHIAFIFQDSKLFKTSIFENVKIGNPESSEEEVLKALKLASCDSILSKFPDKEKTIIGSEGINLSGGEIQRIAIARAILKNADIIVLDEASAAADPENEFEIQLAFSNLIKHKTVIMIAHRLTSIRNVDEILVIEGGKVIERGTDSELMTLNGSYKKMQEDFNEANEWRIPQ